MPLLWYFWFIVNGAFVAQTLRENPVESLRVQPYDAGRRGVNDYFVALETHKKLEAANGNLELVIEALTQHIFSRHPFILDLPPIVLHRYEESKRVAGEYPDGQTLLTDCILERFEKAKRLMENGLTHLLTSSVIDPFRPRAEVTDGQLVQTTRLPESMQRRALGWNGWVQNQIKDGRIDTLFSSHPGWHTIKSAEGSLLPAGNLNIEVVEGVGRARTTAHSFVSAETKLDLPINYSEGYGAGLSDWFAMSHIIEKDLLELAASISPDMIDGMKLTPEVYARAYKPIVEFIDMNPQLDVKGVLSEGTWAYSSELADVFPDQHISGLHDIAGKVVELGSADSIGLPEQVMFATYNPDRRATYEAGDYKVGVAARFIDRQGMISVLGKFGVEVSV